MGLAKLTIKPLNPSKLPEIRVLFNPNTYSITKTVTWSPPSPPLGKPRGTHRLVNAPTLTFGGGGSRQLNLRSEEHTSELQSQSNLVCRLLLEKKKKKKKNTHIVRLIRCTG